MQAAEHQIARRLARGDPGEGAQVVDRQAHHGLFGHALDLIGGEVLDQAAHGRGGLLDPGGDEVLTV
ncbi:hypothetical protein D3C80_1963080 [compost metagenome]